MNIRHLKCKQRRRVEIFFFLSENQLNMIMLDGKNFKQSDRRCQKIVKNRVLLWMGSVSGPIYRRKEVAASASAC